MAFVNESDSLVWIYPEENLPLQEKLVTEFNIHPVTAQVLISRKYTDPKDVHNFLYSKLPQLHPPELLAGIEKATKRLHTALKNNEKILIFGDNDVDGID